MSRLLRRDRCFGSACENDIHFEPDELGRDIGIALGACLPPAILDRDVAALDPAEFAQPLHKRIDPCALRYWPAAAEVPDQATRRG